MNEGAIKSRKENMMNRRLYLDLGESLKLKKTIERLEAFVFHEDNSTLNFSISRNHLKELSRGLFPVSKTKTILEELFDILAKIPLQKNGGQRSIELIEELKRLYRLNTLQLRKVSAEIQKEKG